jgi:hypothetical protein
MCVSIVRSGILDLWPRSPGFGLGHSISESFHDSDISILESFHDSDISIFQIRDSDINSDISNIQFDAKIY